MEGRVDDGFALKQFILGLALFIGGIFLFNINPLRLTEGEGKMNGYDFAILLSILWGVYGWWKFCNKETYQVGGKEKQ